MCVRVHTQHQLPEAIMDETIVLMRLWEELCGRLEQGIRAIGGDDDFIAFIVEMLRSYCPLSVCVLIARMINDIFMVAITN